MDYFDINDGVLVSVNTDRADGKITVPEGVVTAPDDAVTASDDAVTALEGVVTVPDGMVAAPDDAVSASEGVVTVPDGVTAIGKYAFEGCAALTEIVLPDGVASIEQGAFIGCDRLERIHIPDSVGHIGERAFEDCAALCEIDLPDKITAIKRSTFYGCASLARVKLPAVLSTIEDWAFAECTSLTGVELPEGLLSVRNGAFENCSALKSVRLPLSVKSIGMETFMGCDSLRLLEVNLGGAKRRLQLPDGIEGFVYFSGASEKYAFVRYNLGNEVILKRLSSAGEEAFVTDAANAVRNYGQYLSVEDKISELFNWLDIRDGLGSSMKRVTLPPVFVLSAVGFKEEDITKFFRFRKPYFLRLCRSPRFAALNTEIKANVVKLFAVLGGFTGVNSESETALSSALDALKSLSESEIHRYFDGLPAGCSPAHKKALPFFIESMANKGFLEIAARYISEYQEINDDYKATADKMIEKIRRESDENARNLMKAKLKEFKIDVDFINRYIAKHRLHIRRRELEPAIEKYRRDISQGDADFLDDLYEQALKIAAEVEKGERPVVKMSAPGVADTFGGRFRYHWADALDPDLYTLGYSTDCCFKPPENSGAAVLGEAVASPDVWPLIIYDFGGDGAESGGNGANRSDGGDRSDGTDRSDGAGCHEVAAFAIVNYNEDENGLLFDNIEVAPGYLRKGYDSDILAACIRGARDMSRAMSVKGRRINCVNVKYDPFNDLNPVIERELPESANDLRCKIYIYGGLTYTAGGDRPQREIALD